MALIIETGAIVAGADSYVTEAEADLYFANRENTVWDSTDLDKSALLRRACQYIDNKYATRWKGSQVQPLTQNLMWPRAGVKLSDPQDLFGVPLSYYDVSYAGFIPITTIPQKLKDAQCEAALRAISGDLASDLDRGGKISSITVGPISQSFSESAPATTTYQIIDLLLSQFIKTSANVSLVRS